MDKFLKKRLLYIGMEFHVRTRSVDFLLELFGTKYEIVRCDIDFSLEDPYSQLSLIEDKKFDVLVCLQVVPPFRLLEREFTFRNKVYFPMYDACPSIKKPEKWYFFRDFQIISFSKTLGDGLKSIGFCSHSIQYFPKPIHCDDLGEPDSLFFWNRNEKINLNTVACLFSSSGLKKVHVHKVLDPGRKFIDSERAKSFKLSFSDWYETKEEMLKDIQTAAFYMAPRKKEGIGMSFLEAMAMGRCVIAPDYPTMNEYIKHGETGYLYDFKKPKNLQIKNIREMQKNVIQYMEKGYEKWESRKVDILKWSNEPVKVSKIKFTKALYIRFLRNPYKLTKFLIEVSKNRRSV